MKVDSALIQHLAHLSRLHVSPESEPAMIEDLTRILGFVDALNQVDTEGLDPLIYMVDDVNVLRADEPHQEITRKEALKNAPRHDSDYFRVPRFVENEE